MTEHRHRWTLDQESRWGPGGRRRKYVCSCGLVKFRYRTRRSRWCTSYSIVGDTERTTPDIVEAEHRLKETS